MQVNKTTNKLTSLFLLATLLLCNIANAQKQTPKLTLEDIYQRRVFQEKSVSGINWSKNGQFYTSLEANGVVKYDITTGKAVETLVDFSQLSPKIEVDDYSFSADEKMLLFTTNTEAIYRRSFRADYYVYDLAAKTLKPLAEEGRQSYATFSPDGTKVAFVRDNNLFFSELSTNKITQITNDGKFNAIINGSTDWVYEEELGFAQAFFWSPDSKKLAFYKFDESRVKEYNMQYWDEKQVYPVDYRFKYPKAGELNAIVNIFTYNLANIQTTKMDIGTETDMYIPRVKWTYNSEILSIRRLNRLQNKLEVLHAEASTGKSTLIWAEIDENAYVDVEYADDLIYLKNGTQFILTSEQGGYKHFYLYDFTANSSKLVSQITKGNWEVADFVGINENVKPNLIYFTSTEDSPLERHFYSITLDGKKKTKISTEKGTNTVNMSPDFSHYILFNTSTKNPMKVSIFKTDKNELKSVREDNAELRKQIENFGLMPKEFFTFQTKDNTTLHGYWIKPNDFDATKKYPVLMFVYGGPASQSVKDAWSDGQLYYHHYLAQQGYLVACVDNRGTTARGSVFKKSTYANLGKYEVQDQVEAANYIGSQNYVDKSRIGIWGWSYGGYMSSLCMTVGADTFKAGIAVAPVTTWRLYDSIYTERFLKKPDQNADGYDRNSPIMHADKLKGSYLLIHGTGDDNVHFQNAVLFQNALIKAGKQFDSFYYPNRNHGIYGGNTRLHLYQMMTNFWKKSL